MRRKLLWVVGITFAVAVGLYGIWVAAGPRTYLPSGTVRLTTVARTRFYLQLNPTGNKMCFALYGDPLPIGRRGIGVFDLQHGAEEMRAEDSASVRPLWLNDGTLAYFQNLPTMVPGRTPRLVQLRETGTIEFPLAGFDAVLVAAPLPHETKVLVVAQRSPKKPIRGLGWWLLDPQRQTLQPEQPWSAVDVRNIIPAADGSTWTLQTDPTLGDRILFYDSDHKKIDEAPRTVDKGQESRWLRAVSPTGDKCLFTIRQPSLRTGFTKSLLKRIETANRVPSRRTVLNLLYTWRAESWNSTVTVYDRATRRSTDVASFAGGTCDATWHPDGKHLIAQGDGHLWVIPLPQHLWSAPAPGYKGGE